MSEDTKVSDKDKAQESEQNEVEAKESVKEPTLSELLAAQRKIQQNIKGKMERKQTVKNEPIPKPNPNPSVK